MGRQKNKDVLNVFIIQKRSYSKNKTENVVDLYNYPTKSGLNGVTGIDTSKFVKYVDLSSLKRDVDRLEASLQKPIIF